MRPRHTVNLSLTTLGPPPYGQPMVDAQMTGDHGRYLGAVRRMIRAAGRRLGEADPEDLAQLVAMREDLDQAIATAVAGQRAAGTSWAAIGSALGMSKQAAAQRWGRKGAA